MSAFTSVLSSTTIRFVASGLSQFFGPIELELFFGPIYVGSHALGQREIGFYFVLSAIELLTCPNSIKIIFFNLFWKDGFVGFFTCISIIKTLLKQI